MRTSYTVYWSHCVNRVCVWFPQWKHNDSCSLAFPRQYVGLMLLHSRSTWTRSGRPYELHSVISEHLSSISCNHSCTRGNPQGRVFTCDLDNLLHFMLSTVPSLINIQHIHYSSVAHNIKVTSSYQQNSPNNLCWILYVVIVTYYFLHCYTRLANG